MTTVYMYAINIFTVVFIFQNIIILNFNLKGEIL